MTTKHSTSDEPESTHVLPILPRPTRRVTTSKFHEPFDSDLDEQDLKTSDPSPTPAHVDASPPPSVDGWSARHPNLQAAYTTACVILLLLSYFLSQYDKFIVSYFQTEIVGDLSITSAGYGALTGYGTSVLSSFTALPIAYFTDRSEARVWALTIAILWWSLMIVFQSLAKEFWQMICARLGMFFGQSASEAIAVSLISDLVPLRLIPLAESILYVGVYVGEAISARISSVFITTGQSWRTAFRAIGITGFVIGIFTRLMIREVTNRRKITLAHHTTGTGDGRWFKGRLAGVEVWESFKYMMSLRSFWLITLSSSMRQLGGNVFGYYMPTLLQLQYPDDVSYLVATYGTVVGTVGSVACLSGGLLTSFLSPRYPTIALQLTAWGGLVSWPFVVVVTFSRSLGGSSTHRGFAILFANLAMAYITAELWLGAMASLIVRLFPIRYKTLGYATFGLVNLLVYSSGPEIVAIAQTRAGVDPVSDPERYVTVTRIILCVLIPFGYCTAGVGLLWACRKGWFKKDLQEVEAEERQGELGVIKLDRSRKIGYGIGLGVLGALVVGLTGASYALGT